MPINALIAQGVEPIGRDLPQIAQMIQRAQQWEGENQRRNAMMQMDQEQNDWQRERVNNLDQKTAQEGKARQALAQVRWVLQSGASKQQIEQSIPEVAGGYDRLHGPGSWATASDDDVRRSAADAEAKLASSLGEGPPQQEQPKLMKGAGGVMVPEVAGAQFYNEPNAGQSATTGQRDFEYFMSLPPEQQAKYLERQRGYAGPEGAAALEAARSQGRTLGNAQGGLDATFTGDLAKIEDEIARNDRLLAEFQAGKYQTGYLAGKLPNFRTPAQDLQREQGKDVIGAISSATFGALSEGEREFLRNLGISENNSEQSNINLLKERSVKLRNTKARLEGRPSLVPGGPGRAPSGGEGGAPKRVKVDAEGNVIGN